MKRIGVCRENKFLSFDFAITSLTSLTPELTADKEKKGRLSFLDIMYASVVLPTPGGPHKMKDEIFPVSIMLRKIAPLPTRCSCPTYSSKLLGLMRSASGILFPALLTCILLSDLPTDMFPSLFIKTKLIFFCKPFAAFRSAQRACKLFPYNVLNLPLILRCRILGRVTHWDYIQRNQII